MITLKFDRELVRISGWSEVLERPAFRQELDPKSHELKAILGSYVLGDKVHCGLSNCRTQHGSGYLVLTKDGLETNIGKDCGKKYFGAEFTEQKRIFDRDLQAQENRLALWDFNSLIPTVDQHIERLQSGEFGASWVVKQCAIVTNRGKMPYEIYSRLQDMIKQKKFAVMISREATANEVALQEHRLKKKNGKVRYIEEKVGELQGVEVLYPENCIRHLVTIGIVEPLKQFRTLEIDNLSNKDLRYWKKWTSEVEGKLAKADQAMEYARRFFTRANLSQLLKIPELNSRDIDQFSSYLESLAIDSHSGRE